MKRVSGYDSYHLPNLIQLKDGASVIDQIGYNFNAITGNLTSRNDVSNSKNESFDYDNLNRLTSISNGSIDNTISYHANGNINPLCSASDYKSL